MIGTVIFWAAMFATFIYVLVNDASDRPRRRWVRQVRACERDRARLRAVLDGAPRCRRGVHR